MSDGNRPARHTPTSRSAHASVTALRLAGATFGEIADSLGLASDEVAQRMYFEDLASRVTDTDRDLQRQEAKERLERLLRSTSRKAHQENHPEHLIAVRTAQGLIDRLIKLQGLDAPTEVVLYSPTTSEIEAWVANVASRAADEYPAEHNIIDIEPPDAESA